jgi:hypothetical protein
VWSVSPFSREGQSTSRRNAYNEADYNLHYDYAFEICDEWALANCLALKWVTLPGYHADMPTRRERHVGFGVSRSLAYTVKHIRKGPF